MTTKLNQIFANLKAAIMDVKKTEGDTNKIDSFNEVNKIGELLANAEIEIGDVLEKERADLQKQADVLPHSQYVKKENELNGKQRAATSKIEELQSAVEDEKEAMAAALPKYQYYDGSDGQVKNIKNLHKVYPDGSYEVKCTPMEDGSYAASRLNADGDECAVKIYNKDGTPCTDMEKVAELLNMKTDGFFNRIGAILFDMIPFTDHDSARILANLGENEYVRDRTVFRWNEEESQFDKGDRYSSRHDPIVINMSIEPGKYEPPTLDEIVDNLDR